MKCLVVDDSLVTRRIAVHTLREIGFDAILEASDGHQALERCDASVDLVITDWNMPGMGGVELLAALRANPELGHIPVLMITSRQGRQDVHEAARAGVDGYILKPFSSESLSERVLELMARRPAHAPEAEAGVAANDAAGSRAESAESEPMVDAVPEGDPAFGPGDTPESKAA